MKKNWMWLMVGMVVLGFMGCADLEESSFAKSFEDDPVLDTESLLEQAGFRKIPADTQERLNHLMALEQHQIAPHTQNGQTVYIYADATRCDCMYTGDKAAYQRYLDLTAYQHQTRAMALDWRADDAQEMNWDLWGPW